MITHRKLAALRALAERPGTEAEGRVAREILARLESKGQEDKPEPERPPWAAFEAHVRRETSTAEFIEELRRHEEMRRRNPAATSWKCACGEMSKVGAWCENAIGHIHIANSIRVEFKKGDRVYYNFWAYPPNCSATVTNYRPPSLATWAWIVLRFDYLKNPRSVPIYSEHGLHLSHEPLPDVEAERLGRRVWTT